MAEPSDIELATLQAEALFVHDGAGRLLAVNVTGGRMAPRFFIARTVEGYLMRYRHDLPAHAAEQLAALAATAPGTADKPPDPAWLAAIRRVLDADAPVRELHAGPAYRFPRRIAPRGETVRVDEANAATVLDAFPDVARELVARRPCFAVVQDGRAVSLCYGSRRSLHAAEAGVDTLPAHRGRGHAAAVVAAWGRAVREQGLEPLYSTTWDNAASRGVARRLGLVFYAADLHLT